MFSPGLRWDRIGVEAGCVADIVSSFCREKRVWVQTELCRHLFVVCFVLHGHFKSDFGIAELASGWVGNVALLLGNADLQEGRACSCSAMFPISSA